MPLAIELAAARVEALGLGGVLERLDDRLLASATGAAPTASGREAAVDWSYRLLTEQEQRVFRFLWVFLGRSAWTRPKPWPGPTPDPRCCAWSTARCSPRRPPDRMGGPATRCWRPSAATPAPDRPGEEPAAAARLAAHALSTAEQAVAGLARRDRELSTGAGRTPRTPPSIRGWPGRWTTTHRPRSAGPGAGALVDTPRPLGAGIRPAAARRRASGPGRQCLVRRSGLAGSARPTGVRFHQRRPGPQQRGGSGAEGRSAVVRPRRRPGRPGRGAPQLGPAGRGGGRSPHRARPGAPDRLRRGGGARPDGTQRYLDVRRPGRGGRGVGRAGTAGTA